MTGPVPEGVLTASDGSCHWAWVGVEVAATNLVAYAGLSESERRRAASAAERDWLRAWLTWSRRVGGDVPIELRYWWHPETDEVRAALLGRVRGAREDDAVAAAVALRALFADLPPHLRGVQIREGDRLSTWLTPYQGTEVDLVELRKRWLVAGSANLGSGPHLATEPIPHEAADDPAAWAPLWDDLRAKQRPVVITVGLADASLLPTDLARLPELAAFYTSRTAVFDDPMWSSTPQAAPADPRLDRFAELYRDAAGRYQHEALSLRVSLLSPRRVPDSLVWYLRSAVWGADARAVALRPAADELGAALQEVATLEPSRWDREYTGRLPVRPAGVQRRLARTVDLDEATAAFRLPPPRPLPSWLPDTGRQRAPADDRDEATAVTDQILLAIQNLGRQLDAQDAAVRAQAGRQERALLEWGQRLLSAVGETSCPRVFALVPVGKRWDGGPILELRLYCEQPGAWHPLPPGEGCYRIEQPAPWLRRAGPYIRTLVRVLKYVAPFVHPLLGVAVGDLNARLANDIDLMDAFLTSLPDQIGVARELPEAGERASAAALEADFRVLESLLLELDPSRRWGGLSKVTTADWERIYLCREHAEARGAAETAARL